MPATSSVAPNPERYRALHFSGEGPEDLKPVDPQGVDYFEAFGLPPRLCIDMDGLREAFLELSRRVHPDYFATAEAGLREESLRRSALINNAWKTLRDPQRRAEYAIGLLGKGIESNKNAVPPELLEEMFEIQEAGEELREARLSGDAAALDAAEAKVAPLRQHAMQSREKLARQLHDLFGEFDTALENGEQPHSEAAQETLRRIRLVLDQSNYLRTVLRNLK